MDKKPSYEALERRIKQLEGLLKSPCKSSKPTSRKNQDITQLVQAMAIPTFVIDRSHVVAHWNKACEKLTNIRSVDVIGTSDAWKAFYTERRPVLADLVVDFADTEKVAEYYDDFSQTDLVDDGLQAQAFFPLLGKTGKWL